VSPRPSIALIAAFCRVTIVWDAPASAGDGADLTVAERYCLDNWDEKMLARRFWKRHSDAATVLGAAREDLGAAGLCLRHGGERNSA
jgi:hypothetical protein